MDEIITIELLEETFKFKADTNSDVNVHEIIRLLKEEVSQVEANFPAYAQKTKKLAIVVTAALNIAKQNVELKRHHFSFIHEVVTRTEKLDRLIDLAD